MDKIKKAIRWTKKLLLERETLTPYQKKQLGKKIISLRLRRIKKFEIVSIVMKECFSIKNINFVELKKTYYERKEATSQA